MVTTAMSVPYHHPDDSALSLEFINPDRDEVEGRAESEHSDELTAICSYDLDRTIHVLYAGTRPPETADSVVTDLDRLVSDIEEPNRTIALRSLGAFVSIMNEKEVEEGERLRAYKDLEPRGISEGLDRVEWSGTVHKVGGRLLSNLVLRHPFPNANHRTGLVMLERFLSAHEGEFERPRMHNSEYDWKSWANQYIRQSKRILTVRRNAPRFSYLRDFGCQSVIRKGGIEIDLTDWELHSDINEAHSHYATRHESLCIRLAGEIIDRAEDGPHPESGALTKAEFTERLRDMD